MDRSSLDLYRADLDDPPLPTADLAGLLSPREEERAGRMRAGAVRERWVTSRGLVRFLLGHLLGVPPQRVVIQEDTDGKPFVPGGIGFNLSHSGRTLLIGTVAQGRIGVDVEEVRPQPDAMALARRHFSESEVDTLAKADPDDLGKLFLQTWVRKEALIKACGLGLRLPLTAFSVDPARRTGSVLREVHDARLRNVRWRIHAIAEVPGAVAAVAWDGSAAVPSWRPWPGV